MSGVRGSSASLQVLATVQILSCCGGPHRLGLGSSSGPGWVFWKQRSLSRIATHLTASTPSPFRSSEGDGRRGAGTKIKAFQQASRTGVPLSSWGRPIVAAPGAAGRIMDAQEPPPSSRPLSTSRKGLGSAPCKAAAQLAGSLPRSAGCGAPKGWCRASIVARLLLAC